MNSEEKPEFGLVLTPSGALSFPDQARADQRNAALVYLASRQSKRTRDTMRERLKCVAAMRGVENFADFPWIALDFPEVEAIRAQMAARFSIATVNLTLCALRGVFKTAWRLHQIDTDRYHRLLDIDPMRGFRLPAGRELLAEETTRLRAAFEATPGPYGAMLRGLCAVLLGAGLRREEVCELTRDSFNGRALDIIGKGNKQRRIPLETAAITDLNSWINVRRNFADTTSRMFPRVTKDGTVHARGFSLQTLYKLVSSWAPIMAGPGGEVLPVTPHDFRRTYATRLLRRGVDLLIVQRLMGHSKPETTQKYDRRGDAEADQAVNEAEIY